MAKQEREFFDPDELSWQSVEAGAVSPAGGHCQCRRGRTAALWGCVRETPLSPERVISLIQQGQSS